MNRIKFFFLKFRFYNKKKRVVPIHEIFLLPRKSPPKKHQIYAFGSIQRKRNKQTDAKFCALMLFNGVLLKSKHELNNNVSKSEEKTHFFVNKKKRNEENEDEKKEEKKVFNLKIIRIKKICIQTCDSIFKCKDKKNFF